MKKAQRNKELDKVALPGFDDKQSERTTFRLTKEADDAITWMTKSRGISVKETIDAMCTQYLQKTESGKSSFLTDLIQLTKSRESQPQKESIRKTFVLSKGSLRALNKISKDNKVSRDLLLENLILSIEKTLKIFIKERPQKCEKALKPIKELGLEARAKKKELKEFLSEGDPILERIEICSLVIDNLISAIEGYLEDGTPIDPDDYSQS